MFSRVLRKPWLRSILSMMTVNERPTDATEDFPPRAIGAIDGAILLPIGHQTKLFDTLAEILSATSAQIADSAELNERYMREWEGEVVTSRVVDCDPASATSRGKRRHAGRRRKAL
jgi:hypothetical protein